METNEENNMIVLIETLISEILYPSHTTNREDIDILVVHKGFCNNNKNAPGLFSVKAETGRLTIEYVEGNVALTLMVIVHELIHAMRFKTAFTRQQKFLTLYDFFQARDTTFEYYLNEEKETIKMAAWLITKSAILTKEQKIEMLEECLKLPATKAVQELESDIRRILYDCIRNEK